MNIRSLLLGSAAALALVSGAQAADLLVVQPSPVYEDVSAFSFEGFYAGVTAGGIAVSGGGSAGSIGIVAGANFLVSDAILAGVEFQADALYYAGAFNASDFLILGHIGAVVSDNVQVYAALGGGVINDAGTSYGTWAYGVGAEFAVTDSVSLRGEVLGLYVPSTSQNAVKATAGVLFHF
jgi:outer membrane immunogenic protein